MERLHYQSGSPGSLEANSIDQYELQAAPELAGAGVTASATRLAYRCCNGRQKEERRAAVP